MTICIGIKVHDGIVFVADSATSIMARTPDGATTATRVYNHADKLFNLYRGLPVAAITCGLGNFGVESIATIAKDIRRQLQLPGSPVNPDGYSIETIVKFAFDKFHVKYEALDAGTQRNTSFEFFVGGYSANAVQNEIWKFQFSGGDVTEPQCLVEVDNCSIIWAGQPEACIRLVLGISSNTMLALKEAGLDDAQASGLLQMIKSKSEVQLLEPTMPIIDAIRLGEFLAQTTASFVKFLPGADTVGGDLDIATVTKYEGFKWIRRKHFYPKGLNGENDHVS